MDKERIREVLEKHVAWLEGKDGGEKATLYGVDLREADLRAANLYGAELSRTDLREASLYGASLYGATLYGADLREADLRGASLYGADLRKTDLRGASLYGADLRGARLRGAIIEKRIINKFFPIVCPDYGSFTAWKSVRGGIVKLLIPEDAKRSSAYGRKCRASKAIVLAIEDEDGNPLDSARSHYDYEFIYKPGDTVEVVNFDEDRWNECSTGIHFFITRQEAEDYEA